MGHAVDEGAEQFAEHAVELEVQLEGLRAARVPLKQRQVLLHLELGEGLDEADELLVVQDVQSEHMTVPDDCSLRDPSQQDDH